MIGDRQPPIVISIRAPMRCANPTPDAQRILRGYDANFDWNTP
jgi:hypothetical protein